MPTNTSIGMVFCIACTTLSLGLVWYIWWLALLSIAVMPIVFIIRSFKLDSEKVIPAAQIERDHTAWLAQVKQAQAVSRTEETSSLNHGLSALEAAT